MAAITKTRATGTGAITDRGAVAALGTPTGLTAALLLALSVTLGALTLGLAISGVFLLGMLAVNLGGRFLSVDEFAAISLLHRQDDSVDRRCGDLVIAVELFGLAHIGRSCLRTETTRGYSTYLEYVHSPL